MSSPAFPRWFPWRLHVWIRWTFGPPPELCNGATWKISYGLVILHRVSSIFSVSGAEYRLKLQTNCIAFWDFAGGGRGGSILRFAFGLLVRHTIGMRRVLIILNTLKALIALALDRFPAHAYRRPPLRNLVQYTLTYGKPLRSGKERGLSLIRPVSFFTVLIQWNIN